MFAEKNGLVAVEAEHFVRQEFTQRRAFHITHSQSTPSIEPDGDPAHIEGAAGGAYLEVLPDSRRNHDEQLIKGENFSGEPGKLAVVTYKVHFVNPGRYYVWVRAYSSGSEDNGLHVGINNTWPESGQRLQWCEGKKSWRWESKQRTEEQHCGEPHKIFLDVPTAGVHEIHFSMREDGFEFDRWLMTTNRDFVRPEDAGPQAIIHAGAAPAEFAFVAAVEQSSSSANASDKSAAAKSSPTKNSSDLPLQLPRQPDGNGSVDISGDLKQWHKVTLTLDGPYAHELDNSPNPFVNYEMNVTFTHASGSPKYVVPAYFAADGKAGETSAQSGTKWRAHVSPDKPGRWDYSISFRQGSSLVETDNPNSMPVALADGKSGSFTVAATDKVAPDLRARGRLQYVGERYLKFAGSGEYFLKAGPDAPETLLAYVDFDGTEPGRSDSQRAGEAKPSKGLKTWAPHVNDWKSGDPTWKGGKGKGLIGAINYLSSKGCNVFSFLPYNAGGDGDNVWPFVEREDKLHYDCSKLDQWGIVFDHGTARGMYLHFKLQENEIDDNRVGHELNDSDVPESLDGGKLEIQRRLYCREIIARFGHALALNWNLGEENTQSAEEQADMARFLQRIDPYDHHIVVHTFPDQQDKVYPQLLGAKSVLTGASLQNSWSNAHQKTLKWITESMAAGRPWVVCNDEQNPASLGVPPDPGYQGHDGIAIVRNSSGNAKGKSKAGKNPEPGADETRGYTMHDVRKQCLWGTLMAGGAGVEYYFGYQLPQNDLICDDFRSRDKSWDYCRFALEFFAANKIPYWQMNNADGLVGNAKHENTAYCLAKPGEVYLVYLTSGGTSVLDLSGATGDFSVKWFNPRAGGSLLDGSVKQVTAGGRVELGQPPADVTEDWLIIVSK